MEATVGAGTELKLLLRKCGITSIPGCNCDAHAEVMNAEGPDWCAANIDTILDWLKREAGARGVPFVRYPCYLLVRLAIRRARHKLAALEKQP